MASTDVIGLADARKALRLADSDTSHDTDLGSIYVPAVTPVVEDIIGPVISRSFTYTGNGGSSSIVLPHVGVTVTAVTEDGTSLTASTDYVVDSAVGIVYRGTASGNATFSSGTQNVVVTYTAGIAASLSAVPAGVKLAARIILAAMWQADQQGIRPQFSTRQGNTELGKTRTPSGYTIPTRAYELLEPYSDGLPAGQA